MGSTPTTPIMNINFDYCIKHEIFYITYPHDENGWHIKDQRNWSFSIITLVNLQENNWTKNASKYKKPKSYAYAKSIMYKLVGTDKYKQILESIQIYEQKCFRTIQDWQ